MIERKPDYIIFQDGKMQAFASHLDYREGQEDFKLNVRVTKGHLECGEHIMDITREYDVVADNTIGRIGKN